MDKTLVKSCIEGLKSSSTSQVQDCLLKIRSKVTVNDSGIKLFRECGGLDYLLPHLRKPNERILDLALSILGNCCLEEESNTVVGRLNTFGPLVIIIKTVARDSIVGRACRLLGNLAQKTSNAEALHNYGAVTALVALIDNRDKNTSYPTLAMAVRAIRQLWMVTDKREEMLALNAVRCIAILLTKECESAGLVKSTNSVKEYEGLRKSQEELVSSILKCLGYFTTHSTTQCAEQIQGDGRGYQCLVALTKTHELPALKCLMNLCYLSSCRPLLGTAGMVECLVSILQKQTDISWWPEGSARALAQLSGESVNRSRLRHCGGLPLLVGAAKVSAHAMHALLQYVFDDCAFQILVNEGLVNFLTKELITYLSTMEYQHNINESSDSMEGSINKEQPEAKKVKSKKAPSAEKINEEKGKNNEDELKVVIERDNMLVGFVDAVDSGSLSESDEDEISPKNTKGRKRLKRTRSRSPKTLLKKSPLIRMASKDWSSSVYWEPKSPEWSNFQQPCFSSGLSPNRGDQSPISLYSDGNMSGLSPGASSSKRARWDWSPESGVSSGEGSSASPYWTEYQWSPGSSGPTSPFSNYDVSSDSEVSGRYSPVCSEPEGDTDSAAPTATEAAEIDAAQVAHDLDDLMMDDEESVDEEPSEEDSHKIQADTKSCRIACVLVLLFRVSHGACTNSLHDEPTPNHTLELLTGRECLNALLDYVERCKKPLGRAARILARVLSNALCLMSILKHRLVLRLYAMSVYSKHPPNKCQQCKQILRLSSKLLVQLKILAESSYGVGEISHQLLSGSANIKQTLSLTLPYIVRTERPLKKFFVDYEALDLLLTAISECTEDAQECVTAISKLATNVHVKDPKCLENRFKEHVPVSYDPILDDLIPEDIVTFELDDSSIVRANKQFLCQNSDVFSAMLMGCFKESAEKNVRLKKVSKPALEYLFTLLHLGINSPKTDLQIFPLATELETSLEVLLLADRYLFDHMKCLLSSAILQFQLSPETVDRIYTWSLNEGMGFLCVESVAYLLTGKMCEKKRARSFTTILSLEYRYQWLDDIKSIITRQMIK